MNCLKKMNKFGIFILTYKRPNKQLTLEALKKQGYTGKVYLIVDNTDDTIQELIDNYQNRCDEIIVFDKEKYYKYTDTVDNFHNLKSVVYARNASFDIAKRLGLDYFMTIDDDIKQFNYRIVKDNKLISRKIKRLDDVIIANLNFFKNNKVDVLGFADSSLYFGGINGQRYSERLPREAYQCMMFKTDKKINYKGTMCEDLNTTLEYGKQGTIFFNNMLICFNAPKRSTNDGGLKDLYDNNSLYVRNFYSLIVNPSVVKLLPNGKTKNKIKDTLPKIINQRWKK